MNDNKELIAENKSLEDLEGEQWVAVRNSKGSLSQQIDDELLKRV